MCWHSKASFQNPLCAAFCRWAVFILSVFCVFCILKVYQKTNWLLFVFNWINKKVIENLWRLPFLNKWYLRNILPHYLGNSHYSQYLIEMPWLYWLFFFQYLFVIKKKSSIFLSKLFSCTWNAVFVPFCCFSGSPDALRRAARTLLYYGCLHLPFPVFSSTAKERPVFLPDVMSMFCRLHARSASFY